MHWKVNNQFDLSELRGQLTSDENSPLNITVAEQGMDIQFKLYEKFQSDYQYGDDVSLAYGFVHDGKRHKNYTLDTPSLVGIQQIQNGVVKLEGYTLTFESVEQTCEVPGSGAPGPFKLRLHSRCSRQNDTKLSIDGANNDNCNVDYKVDGNAACPFDVEEALMEISAQAW